MDLGSMVPYLKEPFIQQLVASIITFGSVQSIDFDWQPSP
jgi:hypothetical protein